MTEMKEIKKMNDKELADFVAEKREEVRSTRFGGASRNVRAIRMARRDIARAMTELTARTKVKSNETNK